MAVLLADISQPSDGCTLHLGEIIIIILYLQGFTMLGRGQFIASTLIVSIKIKFYNVTILNASVKGLVITGDYTLTSD